MTKFNTFAAAALIALAAAAPALADGEGTGVVGTPANIQVAPGVIASSYNTDRAATAPKTTPALGFDGTGSTVAISNSYNVNPNS